MVDPRIEEVARTKAKLDVEDRVSALGRAIRDIVQDASAHGVLNSGRTRVLIHEAIANEYRVRAHLIWQAYARAFQAAGAQTLTAVDVKRAVEDVLRESENDIDKAYARRDQVAPSRAPDASTRDSLRVMALQRVYAEIDYAVLSVSPGATEGRHGATVNIYQGFGIVQTGAGSTASFTLSRDSIVEIEHALSAAEQEIQAVADPTARQQVMELVEEARAEIGKEQPNGLKVRGALAGIATTLQTAAAAPGAYQVLKGAAALLGLNLP
jgi:hypothetical protein